MNNIYISAAQKSSGKTILSIGLAKIFAEKKIPVRTFKKGPDFIDPSWLKFASSKNSYNLDFNTQSKLEIKNFYNQKKLKFNIIRKFNEAGKEVMLNEGLEVSAMKDRFRIILRKIRKKKLLSE